MEVNVGDITARLRVDASQFDRAMTEAQQRLRALTEGLGQQRTSVEATGTAWQRMLQIAGGLGIVTGIGAITAAVARMASGVLAAGLQMEQLRATMTATSGSAGAAQAQLQALVETAQRLGYSLPALATGFQLISGATRGTVLAGIETQKIFDAVATSARAMGASQGQVERALLAIGQVVSKGTVQMEELRGQLAEAIPGAVQIAARAFGVTTEELNKMVQTGEVRAIPFVRALTRQMQQDLGPAAVQAGETTAAAFARLGNEIRLAAAAIANSGILQALRAISAAATDVLKNIREAVQSRQHVASIFEQEALLGTGLRTEQVAEPMRRRLGELQREMDGLRASLQQWNRLVEQTPSLADDPELAKQRTQLANLEAQRLAILQTAQTIQSAKDVQAQATAEVNRTTVAREREADIVENLRKKLQEIQRDEAQFRQRAAVTPETMGRLGGRPEEAERFRRGLQQVLAKDLEGLSQLIVQRPAGAGALPEDVAQGIARIRQEYAGLEAAQKAADAAEQARQKATQAANTATRQAAREAQQAAEEYQRAIDRVTMALAKQEEQALKTLAEIRSKYTLRAEEQDIDKVVAIQQQFSGNEAIQTQATLVRTILETRDAYNLEVAALQERFTALKQNADAMREHEQQQASFNLSLETTLDKLRVPKEERTEVTLRGRAEAMGLQLTPAQESILKQITAQERFNEVWKVTETLVTTTAGHIQTALSNIASQTTSVAAAFKTMSLNILKSLSDIMMNEAFRILLRVGIRALAGAIMPSGGAPSGLFSNPDGGLGLEIIQPAQHGLGPIHHPTLALLGESRAHNPEFILNRPQMASLLSSVGPSAGGQAMGGSNIVILNYPSQAAAEQRAAQERSLGHQVVLNEVMRDISRGESSQLVRALRTVQR